MLEDGYFTTMHEGDTIAILLKIREQDGKAIMKDITDIIKNYQTRRLRVDKMEDEGLINIITTYSPQKFTHLELTDKGKSVAGSLATINVFVAPGKPLLEKSICMKYAETLLRLLRIPVEEKQSDIIKSLPYYRTLMKTMDALRDDKLITITPTTTSYKTNIIRLTDLGKQVAEVFDIIHHQIVD